MQVRAILRESIQPVLLGTPVETVSPVIDKDPRVREVRPIDPRLAGRRIRKSRSRQPIAKVRNGRVLDAKRKRIKALGHG